MPPKTTVVVNHNGMGQSDTALTHKLAANYFRLLGQNDLLPTSICFYADGVKLLVKGSPVIAHLQTLQNKGVVLLACKTCLDFHGLLDQVVIGDVGSMEDIIDAQWNVERVITL